MRYGLGWLARLFSSGQEKEIAVRCDIVKQALNLVPDGEPKTECHHWLASALQAIEHWPVAYTDFDKAWIALHEIRHKFCRLLPVTELDRLVLDIRDDLAYVANATERKSHLTALDAIAAALAAHHGANAANPPQLDKNRDLLLHLSLLGAGVKETQWHKVNLLRSRLFITAVWMFLLEAFLVAGMIATPHSFGVAPAERCAVLGVVAFGSLGGFLSALSKHEPLAGSSVAFYLERAALILRPVIGAAAGLIIYLLLLAGMVTIAPQSAFPATYFVAAFGAGFSERFFLGQLSKVLAGKDGTGKKSPHADADAC